MSSVHFSDSTLKKFKETVAKYEQPSCALMPTLYLAQEEFGYLSQETIDYVASLLEMPPNHVHEVVTFYGMYKKKDMGKHCVQICTNITCTMMGADDVVKAASEELKLGLNEVSADKKFSLQHVQCLGACDVAPVAQINDDYHENLTPESIRTLLRGLK